MTEEQNETMNAVLNTMASQMMDQILGLFVPGTQIGMLVTFPAEKVGEGQDSIFLGTMTTSDAVKHLSDLDADKSTPEYGFMSRHDGGLVEKINPTDIN